MVNHVPVILIAYKLNKKITAYVFHNKDQFREEGIKIDRKIKKTGPKKWHLKKKKILTINFPSVKVIVPFIIIILRICSKKSHLLSETN